MEQKEEIIKTLEIIKSIEKDTKLKILISNLITEYKKIKVINKI